MSFQRDIFKRCCRDECYGRCGARRSNGKIWVSAAAAVAALLAGAEPKPRC